ncbi:MAG: serine/threonine protein kinase, partial [Candidatus Aminicenantes bacterium]|nr:serine/threonine protein kinase [Candidatus Aminicenantes bacterium]
MIRVGQTQGDFQIKAEIGRGGMGTIYYAVDTMLNREVALKVIHSELASNFQLMERFKVEAMTQGQMNHPNIVTVFSFTKIDDENVIAMEYVDGKNLKVLLREQNILSISDAVYYLKQICKGLKYAHDKNIIHRDIKPANVLIDNENRVKLSDFGIAKVFGKQGLTKRGMLLGTPW